MTAMENKIERLIEHGLGIAPVSAPELKELLQHAEAQQWMKDIARIVNALPFTLEPQQAPETLKTRVLHMLRDSSRTLPPVNLETETSARQAATPSQTGMAAGLYVQRKHEGTWSDPGIPGVAIKNLFVDHHTGYTTMLVRMAPDSWFPRHLHSGYEECLMLEGEVRCGDLQLFAGDYQRMTGDAVHEALYSREGCMFLVIASEENQVL